jgi:hypothetical protein
MKRRDFFKSLLGAGCSTLLPNAPAQVLHPPHGKRKGILTIPGALSMHDIERIRDQWHTALTSEKIIVLSGGMKYEEVYISQQTELRTK